MNMKPQLDQKISLTNALTGAEYLLQLLWMLEASSKNIDAIVAICNQTFINGVFENFVRIVHIRQNWP
jgi:hypothetical protein